MNLRLRQLALVAARLAPAEEALADVFGLTACHRDPAVAEFGLENVLFPLGNQFLEIVAPRRPGTAAGRYLERRGGDGGYMVITQCKDHARFRARAARLGVRIAHEFRLDAFTNMQLHPRDTGGSFLEIDEQLGDGAEAPDGPWAPAGSHPVDDARSQRVTAIAAAEIQADDPHAVAARWSALTGAALATHGGTPCLGLDDATLRFVPCTDGRPEGLAGLDLVAADPAAVLAAAMARGLAVADGRFELAGMRWSLV